MYCDLVSFWLLERSDHVKYVRVSKIRCTFFAGAHNED